jgi:hypothetical protein
MYKMAPSPVGSFMRFLVGFTVFISVGFGVTYAVQTVATNQEQEQQTAAAIQAALENRQ